MIAQVVVLRELVAALFGVELLYVLALGPGWSAPRPGPPRAGGCRRGRRGYGGLPPSGLLVPAELVLLRTAGPAAAP